MHINILYKLFISLGTIKSASLEVQCLIAFGFCRLDQPSWCYITENLALQDQTKKKNMLFNSKMFVSYIFIYSCQYTTNAKEWPWWCFVVGGVGTYNRNLGNAGSVTNAEQQYL